MSSVMEWFRRDGVISYSAEGRIYRGKVNRHTILIKRDPGEIYSFLTNLDQWKQWAPFEEILVEKITPGDFSVGTQLRFKLRFRIQPEWNTEVIHLEKDRQIIYRFLDGIFAGGIEIWSLKKRESETEVAHTLLYQIHRWIYKIGWSFLGGEKKHNELTELALSRLKMILEVGS